MIKFFRKIRQNLLIENKTGKYLKYAIGEIILVVIGILIALQINNWNEQRKNQDNVHLSLFQILNDLLSKYGIKWGPIGQLYCPGYRSLLGPLLLIPFWALAFFFSWTEGRAGRKGTAGGLSVGCDP